MDTDQQENEQSIKWNPGKFIAKPIRNEIKKSIVQTVEKKKNLRVDMFDDLQQNISLL